MPKQNLKRFYLSIVFPSVFAIGLFIISFYLLFLPAFENAAMNDKKAMISELTNTAWSLIDEYARENTEGTLSLEEAQAKAIQRVSKIRYGDEQKDYFWIINQQPKMLMHPYTPELVGKDLNGYTDPKGKKLFVEALNIIQQNDSGFINYMWQWKDDPSQIVPKLSYVKSFEPWGWIIGTGIYLDDVQVEIAELKKDLLRISLVITVIISAVLLFVVKQSLNIEEKRMRLTAELRSSRRKYKTLVEASDQGMLISLNEEIIFTNKLFCELSGYSNRDIVGKNLQDLFYLDWDSTLKTLSGEQKNLSLEAQLNCANGESKSVLLSISKVQYSGQEGIIVALKEISQKIALEKETEKLTSEMQTSLLLTKQPIKYAIKDILPCPADSSILDAAELMNRKQEKCIYVRQQESYIGIVTANDFATRALGKNLDLNGPITQIMTAPIVTLSEDALLYEALLQFSKNHITYLATTDKQNTIVGQVSYRDITALQQNTVSYFVQQIETAESVKELVTIHKKVPSLVLALLESGDKTENITGIITAIADAFTSRVIELGIESHGEPPCKFVFMIMGSEGRMEQTLLTDQDNAIIFEDVSEDRFMAVQDYFLKLGNYICLSLDAIGYNYCKGGIMACNPNWNKPYSKWREYFDGWINSSDIADIVEASIFFDFKGIYGELSLTKNLRTYVTEAVKDKGEFLHGMAESVSNYKSPVGVFGNLVGNDVHSKDKTIDIKMILMPVVKFSRLYCLQNGIEETNTLRRIRKLYAQEIISPGMYEELNLSYSYLMQMRFRAQARSLLTGQQPSNKMDVSELTHIEVATLKKIFSEINSIPSMVNSDFR
ncbi:CBS domain-containing protein [Alteromonadaceae bacterium Bs31]|nr:CBS domain-containing protein [Alteromonadaceae bacterium Bs31]